MDYLHYFKAARSAARSLATLSEEQTAAVLTDLADTLDRQTAYLLEENRKDLDRMEETDPKFDRLRLNAMRLADVANDIRNVVRLKSPLGTVIASYTRPNGLQISKIRVPLGVVGIIYEARPNVTLDVFSLCFKTGNVCLLKGGSDAKASNAALVALIHQVLRRHQLPDAIVSLLPVEREAADALLNAVGYVDVLIPRGSQNLIDHVRRNSRVPVIETGAGIVHTYFDEWGDLSKGKAVIENAKTRRVSVCNALDCLLIDRKRLPALAELVEPLAQKGVELFADEAAWVALQTAYPPPLLHKAEGEHFGTEFLSLKMAVKTVNGIDGAMDHIAEYGSKHSEAIVTENEAHERLFLQMVDAAAVYSNASTAFTDGAQFGLGAEIGISTQKLHARGPMGLEELTSYKWIIKGDGQIRG